MIDSIIQVVAAGHVCILNEGDQRKVVGCVFPNGVYQSGVCDI